jgi:hypothetical protein
MARAGRQLAIAHGAQLPAERLLGDRDAALLEYPLRQIDQPPAPSSAMQKMGQQRCLIYLNDVLPIVSSTANKRRKSLLLEELRLFRCVKRADVLGQCARQHLQQHNWQPLTSVPNAPALCYNNRMHGVGGYHDKLRLYR